MSINLKRQLKDIQNEADKIIHGKPSLVDVRNFQKYSDEMKKYIRKHSTNTNVLKKLGEIPMVIDLEEEKKEGFFTIIFVYFLGFFLFWFIRNSKINKSKQLVKQAKSVYASIEFLNVE